VADHLTQQAATLLEAPDAVRVRFIRSPRWIRYPRANQILQQMEDLLDHPKMHRMPGLLIVGDTNNGKTEVVQRFEKLHPPNENPQGDRTTIPVLRIQAPPIPEEKRFYNAILEQLFMEYRPNERVERKQAQVINLLGDLNVRMLMIDEIHHVLAGTMNKQRAFLNVIKYLANELQIPIVAAGIKDAHSALQTDPQLANRFEPTPLPRWEIGEDLKRLLRSFEQILPLREPSALSSDEMSLKILSMSEGTIGEIDSLLRLGAIEAIRRGKERIDAKLLEGLRWMPPSRRKWWSEQGG